MPCRIPVPGGAPPGMAVFRAENWKFGFCGIEYGGLDGQNGEIAAGSVG